MKRVLITGADSYIGVSVEHWLLSRGHGQDYAVDTLDMRQENWREKSFSGYDTVLHLAGIVHRGPGEISGDIYEAVNCELAFQTFLKSAAEGVGQFLFMSSAAVFSQNDRAHRSVRIRSENQCFPVTEYGKSKRRAEKKMLEWLETQKEPGGIRLAILRPPMVYGPGARGNYVKLSAFAKRSPLFPLVENERSMIFIDNLCECIRLLIENRAQGIYHPQNREYVNTSAMVREIAKARGRKMIFTKLFNPFLFLLARKIDRINKVFGDYTYEKALSGFFGWEYCVTGFQESIRRTEEL